MDSDSASYNQSSRKAVDSPAQRLQHLEMMIKNNNSERLVPASPFEKALLTIGSTHSAVRKNKRERSGLKATKEQKYQKKPRTSLAPSVPSIPLPDESMQSSVGSSSLLTPGLIAPPGNANMEPTNFQALIELHRSSNSNLYQDLEREIDKSSNLTIRAIKAETQLVNFQTKYEIFRRELNSMKDEIRLIENILLENKKMIAYIQEKIQEQQLDFKEKVLLEIQVVIKAKETAEAESSAKDEEIQQLKEQLNNVQRINEEIGTANFEMSLKFEEFTLIKTQRDRLAEDKAELERKCELQVNELKNAILGKDSDNRALSTTLATTQLELSDLKQMVNGFCNNALPFVSIPGQLPN